MNIQAEWFKNWFDSPYYHQLYFRRNTEEAGVFIDKLIEYLQPPHGASMLDVACGKGRHSKILASMGYNVTGIDVSVSSIEEAKKWENDALHFYIHDMRLPFWINYFDYAFNFFTSFGYFRSERENSNAIRTISASLKPSGVFVLDYLNTPYAEANLTQQSEKEINGVHYNITKWMDEKFFYKKIEIQDKELPQPLIFTETVAKYTLNDFTRMLAHHGLQIQEVFGNYQFETYNTEDSPRLIMVAKK